MNVIARVQSVSKVEVATEPSVALPSIEVFSGLLNREVFCCSQAAPNLVSPGFHSFVAAVHVAFAEHRPLVLSPDMFWLLITQGLAHHIDSNPEVMREKFVTHQGQARIVVCRDEFSSDPAANPWEDVIGEFSSKILEHIGARNHANLVANFSTTGAVEQVASEIVLMAAMKSYFRYECHTMCGIPEVTLEGTPEDWAALPERAAAIGEAYELSGWTDRIVPRLKKIALNAAGKNDKKLWENIYKLEDMSGGPYISGWILDFFPYLQRQTLDEGMVTVPNWTFQRHGDFGGPTVESLPNGLSVAPFIWNYLGSEIPMAFAAGFAGFTEDRETFAVRPNIGWAVSGAV